MFVPVGTVLALGGETSEVIDSPETTGDRYRVRTTVVAGGGPGIKGDGPHTHPGLVEAFRVVSGRMTVRLGRKLVQLGPGDEAEVPRGVLHGFVNPGPDPLEVVIDLVFTPPGPRPEADLVRFAFLLDRLAHDGQVGRGGTPSWAQMALLLRERFPQAMAQPGLGGLLMKALAVWGHLRGLRTEFPEYEAHLT